MEKGEEGYLDLIREVGALAQLRDMHERVVDFYQKNSQRSGRMDGLAQAAAEAYEDTQEIRYALIAMEAYERMADFQKAFELAQIADPKKAKILEKVLKLIP